MVVGENELHHRNCEGCEKTNAVRSCIPFRRKRNKIAQFFSRNESARRKNLSSNKEKNN
jgi:hypothetical protein